MELVTGTGEREVDGPDQAAREIDWSAEYSDCAGDLFGFLAPRVGRDLAEDLLADTFASAMTAPASFDSELGTTRSWLFGIASNHARRHWRTEERRLRALARDGAKAARSIDRSASHDRRR